MLLTAIVLIAILSLLVLIHELGHFLVAKRMGVWVEEFGIGLPPRVFGKKIGETIYSLNLLPFGGFVKLHGEDQVDEKAQIKEEKRAFFARPIAQRASIITAGVFMNAILAVVIYYGFLTISNFKTELPLLFDHKFFAVDQRNKTEIIITNVSSGSPAKKAGIKSLSKISEINGKEIKSEQEFLEIIKENREKKVAMKLVDLKTLGAYDAEVVPRANPPEGEGPLGISFAPAQTAVLSYDKPLQKILSGVIHPVNLLAYNFRIFQKLIALSFAEKTAAPVGEAVSGPVGIASVVGSILQIPDLKEKILQSLNLVGLISISLAFFNILPIPALDGGRLLFIGIEAVFGRKVRPKIEVVAHQVGFIILILLIMLVTYNDLLRFDILAKIKDLL